VKKLSIIVTVYNTDNYIQESLDSIFNNPPDLDYEVILVNDGSTDKTRDILISYTNKPNVRLLENKNNEGIPVSRNRALLASVGEYVAIHDADDISLPNRFDEEVSFLDKHPYITFIGGHAVRISTTGEIIGSMVYPPKDTLKAFSIITRFKLNPIIDPSCMYRREEIMKNGGYSMDPQMRTVLDFELWCRLLVKGYRLHNIQHPVIKYRINPNGVTRTKKKSMVEATDEVWSAFRRRTFKDIQISHIIFEPDCYSEY